MKTIQKIQFNLSDLDLALSLLNDERLGWLFRALLKHFYREEDKSVAIDGMPAHEVALYNMLCDRLDEYADRVRRNRENGSKGGRKANSHEQNGKRTQNPSVNPSVSTKKSKKEDLPPTPPIEEKNKKNNFITPSLSAGAREETLQGEQEVTDASVVRVPELEELQEQLLNEQPWFDQLCMSRRISAQDMAMYIMDFIKYLREQDVRETLPHAKAHFVNQLPYIIKIYKTNNNHENSQRHFTDPVARREYERECRRQECIRAIAELAAQGEQPFEPPF